MPARNCGSRFFANNFLHAFKLCFPLKSAVLIFVFKLGTAFAFSACPESGTVLVFAFHFTQGQRDGFT